MFIINYLYYHKLFFIYKLKGDEIEMKTKAIPIKLENGKFLYIEVSEDLELSLLEEKVCGKNILQSSEVIETIKGFSQELSETLNTSFPDKALLSFGFNIEVKEGKLVTLLASGKASASINIALEWSKKS